MLGKFIAGKVQERRAEKLALKAGAREGGMGREGVEKVEEEMRRIVEGNEKGEEKEMRVEEKAL